MAEISRRAGVGMATLYRNFPGRRELLEALFKDEVDAMCAAAERVDGDTPGAVVTAWLRQFYAFATTKRHVVSELLAYCRSRSRGPRPRRRDGALCDACWRWVRQWQARGASIPVAPAALSLSPRLTSFFRELWW
jgi:AcrR family transcriptional regulator